MKKLFCFIVIAFGLSACSENDMESPATRSAAENQTTSIASGNIEKENVEDIGISSSSKTQITQAEFDQIIANTPTGQPIVIQDRFGSLSIGDLFVPGYHPELLVFNFIDCDFESLVVQNTTQAIVDFNRCTVNGVILTTGGIVQQMDIRRSRIEELRTIDGSHCAGLSIIKSKISLIVNDSGNDSNCFRFIGFD
jgi:hypothetical protein